MGEKKVCLWENNADYRRFMYGYFCPFQGLKVCLYPGIGWKRTGGDTDPLMALQLQIILVPFSRNREWSLCAFDRRLPVNGES